jgi:hypothetical protein
MSKLLLATVTFVLLAASVPSYTQEATGQYTIVCFRQACMTSPGVA